MDSLIFHIWSDGCSGQFRLRYVFILLSRFDIFFWYYNERFHEKELVSLYKNWSFPLNIFSVNVTKSAGNCRFGHIYWKIFNGKLHFLYIVDGVGGTIKHRVFRDIKSGKVSTKMPNILQYMLVQYWMELHLFTYQSKEFWKSQKISIVLQEYLVPWRFIKLPALLQQMVFVKWHFIIPQWNKHRFMSNGMRRMGTQILAATKNFHYRTTLWSYMCWVPWNLCSRSRLVGMFFHLRIHSLTYFYQF